MVKVSDYIANFIHDYLAKDVFMITGGGAMHLNDSIGKHPGLNVIANHHEQASAMGAVGYAKYTNDFAVVVPTTGCGGTNTITGLLDAWQDNVRVFFISGQVNSNQTTHTSNVPLRQHGVQEADIISIVTPITKYAKMITNPEHIRYELEFAVFIAKTGRPGPVWIDVPMDVQNAYVDENALLSFRWDIYNEMNLKADYNTEIQSVIELLKESKRPLIIAGNGIRLSGAENEFSELISNYLIPFATSYLALDLLPAYWRLHLGRIGTKGTRAANMAVQNADLIINIGCRLHASHTGYDVDNFAPNAKIVTVDIDSHEHEKNGVKIHKSIICDAKDFINDMVNFFKSEYETSLEWIETVVDWKTKWDYEQLQSKSTDGIDLYEFIDALNNSTDATIVSDAGSAFYVTSQALRIKTNQRYITSGAQAEMGFTIPAAIGVSFATNKGRVVGITGDGSFQFNIQELQTIKHHNLPIKLFVLNNDGYLSIKNTQNSFFNGRYCGIDKNTGVSFPNLEKIANAYEISYIRLDVTDRLIKKMQYINSIEGPVIIEVCCSPTQLIKPNVSAIQNEDGSFTPGKLENMMPVLSE